MSESNPRNSGEAGETASDDGTASNDAGGLAGLSGWLVVAILFLAGIVAPMLLYYAGQTGELQTLGLGFRDTYLAVPMIPAVLLGALGIWSALKDR